MPVLALELGGLCLDSAQAGLGGFGLGLLVRLGFFDAKAGFVEGCNLWNVLYNPEAYVW